MFMGALLWLNLTHVSLNAMNRVPLGVNPHSDVLLLPFQPVFTLPRNPCQKTKHSPAITRLWEQNIKKKCLINLSNSSHDYLCWSDTVSIWYVIWCFVLKESLWWSYTDLSWKSRLSLRGWWEKRKKRLRTVRNTYFHCQKGAFGLVYLRLMVRYTPPGAGQCSCIMEVTPWFLTLGEVGGLIIRLPLHSRERKRKWKLIGIC